MVGLSSTTPTTSSLVSLLAELDVSLPAERTGTVVDHFNYDTISAAETHDVLVLDAAASPRAGVKPYFALPDGAVLAVPHTAGHVLGNSHLLTPILRAPDTAYSYNPKEQADTVEPDELFAAGRQLALVSALQARNSARVSIIGAEILQDKWLDAKVAKVGGKKTKTENKEFARRLSGWTFHEIGVLRVNDVQHRLVGSDEANPSLYRIKNDVVRLTHCCPQSHHDQLLTLPARHTPSRSPSTAGTSGCPLRSPRRTSSSSSSPCCRPFTA